MEGGKRRHCCYRRRFLLALLACSVSCICVGLYHVVFWEEERSREECASCFERDRDRHSTSIDSSQADQPINKPPQAIWAPRVQLSVPDRVTRFPRPPAPRPGYMAMWPE